MRLRVGWGIREISSKEPVSIPGQMYLRISEGILDQLYATALCLDSGEGSVIFCSCDLGNFNSGVLADTLKRVAALRPEIPADSVILNATHTHTCCDTRDKPEKSPDGKTIYPSSEYRKFFVEQCAQAICESWDSRAPGGIAYGYGYAVAAHSRRTVYFEDMSEIKNDPVAPNGRGVMYGGPNHPLFSHFEAGADAFVNLLYTVDGEGNLTGMVVNVPCPSQLSEHFTKLSADYWNEVREGVKREFGENVRVLPQCAAAGDLSPRILYYKAAQCRRMRLKYGLSYPPEAGFRDPNRVMGERYDLAERVCDAVRETWSWAKKDIKSDVPVSCRRIPADISARTVTAEEKAWCEANIEKMRGRIPAEGCASPEEIREAVTHFASVKARNETAIRRFETQKPGQTCETALYAVRVGETGFAFSPFELYMDYMHRLQARSPFVQTFVVQLAGDEYGGYLPTERGMENKGYSASLFDNRVSPAGGQEVVELTLAALGALYDETEQGGNRNG